MTDRVKAKTSLLEEVQENYEIARKLFMDKEKELDKVKEGQLKEAEKDGLDRMKLEDKVRCLILENERLQHV